MGNCEMRNGSGTYFFLTIVFRKLFVLRWRAFAVLILLPKVAGEF